MWRALSFGSLAAAAGLVLLGAQPQQSDCDLEVIRTPGSKGEMTTLPGGETRIDQWGGVEAVCGSRRLRADSASWFQNEGTLYLFGNIEYTDEARRLTAERATYYERESWVRCEGDVRLTDSSGRSALSGPVLDYYPLNASRPVERIFAPGRPHLTFYPDSGAAGTSPPFEVDADRMHIYGDSAIAGAGDVVAVRGELTATGDSLDLDLGPGEIWLLGEPDLVTGTTELDGDTLLIRLEENRVREIEAWPNGAARGQELALNAPRLRLFTTGEAIDRIAASAGDPARTGAVDTPGRAPWAAARSAEYELIADSIDIRRPAGRLEQLVAVGRAHAIGLDPPVPGGGALNSDWIEGDTITGYFEARDSLSASGGEPQLTRLEASGSARALYYMREEEGGDSGAAGPGLNYVIGRVITLFLEAGEVREALVLGPSTGVYLEPLPQAADTAAADTAAAADSAAAQPDTALTPPRRGGAR